MACEYCGITCGEHDYRCPNYIPPRTRHYCSICGECICDGEEYIENSDGEIRHCDCFCEVKELVEWLGYEVKTMKGEY